MGGRIRDVEMDANSTTKNIWRTVEMDANSIHRGMEWTHTAYIEGWNGHIQHTQMDGMDTYSIHRLVVTDANGTTQQIWREVGMNTIKMLRDTSIRLLTSDGYMELMGDVNNITQVSTKSTALFGQVSVTFCRTSMVVSHTTHDRDGTVVIAGTTDMPPYWNIIQNIRIATIRDWSYNQCDEYREGADIERFVEIAHDVVTYAPDVVVEWMKMVDAWDRTTNAIENPYGPLVKMLRTYAAHNYTTLFNDVVPMTYDGTAFNVPIDVVDTMIAVGFQHIG